MFREINISKQSDGGPKRRWDQSEYFDLYVFSVRHSERMDKFADREFVGMQLCYDIRRNQRTLEWKKAEGFSHHAVKKGEGDTLSDHGASAALLQQGGVFESAKVLDRFMADSGALPGQIKLFVLQKLADYAKLNPPAPPTQEQLAAAAAAASVAEQIAAQVEAEADMLRAEQASAKAGAAQAASAATFAAMSAVGSAVAAVPDLPLSLRPRQTRVNPPPALVPTRPAADAGLTATAPPAAQFAGAASTVPASAAAAVPPPQMAFKNIEEFSLDDLLNKP